MLLRRLPAQVVSSLRGVEVFRGELVDVPGSWARVTRYGAEITGVIFDGAELFAIDSPIQLAPYLRSREPGSSPGPIIYRWRDTAGALTDELGMPFDVATSSTAPAESVAPSALDPGRQLDLGLGGGHGFQHEHARGVERGCEHVEPREHRRRDFHFPAQPARQRRGS